MIHLACASCMHARMQCTDVLHEVHLLSLVTACDVSARKRKELFNQRQFVRWNNIRIRQIHSSLFLEVEG